MKILVLGYARHGKDTFAEWLTKATPGMTFCSSSRFAADLFIYKQLCDWGDDYESAEECYEDRANQRGTWHHLIAEYNKDDPARLAKEMLKAHDVYVGMRAKREVIACFEDGLFDVVYWVDASHRLPPESKDSMDFGLDWLTECPERNCELVLVDNNRRAEMVFKERYQSCTERLGNKTK